MYEEDPHKITVIILFLCAKSMHLLCIVSVNGKGIHKIVYFLVSAFLLTKSLLLYVMIKLLQISYFFLKKCISITRGGRRKA